MIKPRLIRLLSHAKKYIAWNVIWQWLALLSQIAAVFTIAQWIERVLYGTCTTQYGVRAVGVLVLVVCVRFLCDRMAARASYLASADVKRMLRDKIFDKLLRLGVSYREQTATAEVLQLCGDGVEQLETYFGKYLPQLFYSLLAPLTLFAVLVRVNVQASVVLLLCVPLIPVSIVVVQKIAKRLLSNYWGLYTELGDNFLENLQGLTTLKIYQADEKKAQEMDEEAQKFRRITMKVLTMQLNSTSVMDIVAYGGAAVGMAVAVWQFYTGRLPFADTLKIVLLAAEFFIPLRLLGSFFHIAMNGMAASDKIFALLDLPEPEERTQQLPKGKLSVCFDHVCFSYEQDREILKDVSISIPADGLVSLVGESGCGKSTIAGILSGRNQGYTGSVLVGGKDLHTINEQNLTQRVSLIRHNSYLFKGTVADNLRMAKPQATEQEMCEVLRQVALWDFLRKQHGLETALLENAGNLSGGQRQRLALARAILADRDIMIFDEATSNIDVESEELIMKVIQKLAKTKTVLLISHRLQNVIPSDCIYMMQGGRILEQGTHDQLIKQAGAYQALYCAQQELEQYTKEATA